MLLFLSVTSMPFARHPAMLPLSVAPPRSRVTGFAGSVPSVSFVASSVAPPDIASVPSATTVCSVRDEPRVSVPAPVFSSAPTVCGWMTAVAPEATGTVGAESVSVPAPPTVALARNAKDATVTESPSAIVVASPEFSNTAEVDSCQSPATPFFDHFPAVFHETPDAPSFHTYSPASVSSTITWVPPLATLSA